MANKTVATKASVQDFLNAIEPAQRRKDAKAVSKMMKDITGCRPKMWGASIVGFDTYHYTYASGREGDFLITGFSPRKTALTLYIMGGFSQYDDLLAKLGKFKTGKSCLYLKQLDDVDLKVLKRLIRASVQHMRKKYPKP